jgi:hypothetical protein
VPSGSSCGPEEEEPWTPPYVTPDASTTAEACVPDPSIDGGGCSKNEEIHTLGLKCSAGGPTSKPPALTLALLVALCCLQLRRRRERRLHATVARNRRQP